MVRIASRRVGQGSVGSARPKPSESTRDINYGDNAGYGNPQDREQILSSAGIFTPSLSIAVTTPEVVGTPCHNSWITHSLETLPRTPAPDIIPYDTSLWLVLHWYLRRGDSLYRCENTEVFDKPKILCREGSGILRLTSKSFIFISNSLPIIHRMQLLKMEITPENSVVMGMDINT